MATIRSKRIAHVCNHDVTSTTPHQDDRRWCVSPAMDKVSNRICGKRCRLIACVSRLTCGLPDSRALRKSGCATEGTVP